MTEDLGQLRRRDHGQPGNRNECEGNHAGRGTCDGGQSRSPTGSARASTCCRSGGTRRSTRRTGRASGTSGTSGTR